MSRSREHASFCHLGGVRYEAHAELELAAVIAHRQDNDASIGLISEAIRGTRDPGLAGCSTKSQLAPWSGELDDACDGRRRRELAILMRLPRTRARRSASPAVAGHARAP